MFHILNSFDSFTRQERKEKGQKFASRAVINIYFNNKRKLRTDSVMKHKVKVFKKDKEKSKSKNTQGNFFGNAKYVFWKQPLKPVLENRCSKIQSQNR